MLQTLDVAMTHFVVSSWGVVASCNWAQLQSLDMRGNRMDCDKLAELVCADWPLLEELHLSELLDANSINMLIGEQWPQLQMLEIRNSNLDDTMMHLLATADWPLLEWLELHGLSQMTDQGIRHLLRAGCLLIRRLLCGALLHSWHMTRYSPAFWQSSGHSCSSWAWVEQLAEGMSQFQDHCLTGCRSKSCIWQMQV